MWLLIFGTYAVGLVADNAQESQARHNAVCITRAALDSLYDYAEELRGLTPEIAEARRRLDAVIPDESC